MMVQFTIPGLTLLSIIARIEASSSKADISANFTFHAWIESVIADPNGQVLSPDEAVAAWNHTQATKGHSPLQKRFSGGCNTIPDTEASVSLRDNDTIVS